MVNIARNLKLIRLVMDKTQAEFAETFNVTTAMISSYEKARALPDHLFISRVAKMAGITEEQLRVADLKEEDLKWHKENGQNRENAAGLKPGFAPPTKNWVELYSLVQVLLSEAATERALRLGIPLDQAVAELEQIARTNAYVLSKMMEK